MSIATCAELLQWADERRASVAAFNVHCPDMALGVLDAAEELGCPVIIQVNEGMLDYACMDFWAATLRVLSADAGVPAAIQLDHSKDVDCLRKAIAAGFTGVMYDGSHLSLDENIARTCTVVTDAHASGVSVEAELGKVVGVEDGITALGDNGCFTEPAFAEQFAAETGVDSLAVSVGTKHGQHKGDARIDFARLDQIRQRVSIPLVLHGGSGVGDDALREAVECGVRKVNFSTELRREFTRAVRAALGSAGDVEPLELLRAGRSAVRMVARAKMELLSMRTRLT